MEHALDNSTEAEQLLEKQEVIELAAEWLDKVGGGGVGAVLL
jgi:hypothetical protein